MGQKTPKLWDQFGQPTNQVTTLRKECQDTIENQAILLLAKPIILYVPCISKLVVL